jgi:hypothetical protein
MEVKKMVNSPGTDTKKDQKWLTATREIYLIGFLALAVSIAIVSALAGLGIKTQLSVPAAVSSGASIYAIFYLLAQFDERLVEPFSNTSLFGGHDDPNDDTPSQKKKVVSSLQSKNAPNQQASGDPPKPKNGNSLTDAESASLKQARTISLWCLASGIGIILCYITVGFLQVVGISASHFWDAILSGVIVGGGTKPLHDFINLLDNKSSSKSNNSQS